MAPMTLEPEEDLADTWTDDPSDHGSADTFPAGNGPAVLRTHAGAYRLRSLLAGPHRQVFLADDLGRGGSVVVKVLPSRSPRPDHERRALESLQIPGVVRLVDCGEVEGRPFLVLEHISGTRFPSLVPWPVLVARAQSLLDTVARMHAQDIAHGDLKPSNVLVTDDGAVAIIDLALASGGPLGDPRADPRRVYGTPAYMAPEMFSGAPASPATDIYAIGVLLYEALAGFRPNESSGGMVALVLARQSADPPPLRDHAPEVPERLAWLIVQMLAREPADRPSAAEALEVLGDVALPPPEAGEG